MEESKVKCKFSQIKPGTAFVWEGDFNVLKVKTDTPYQPYMYLESGKLVTKYDARNDVNREVIIRALEILY